MRGADGAIRRRPTRSSDGLLKNPSVMIADAPSSISRVVTPAQVTVRGAWPAAGRSKNSA
jgi:hypothetical protein